MEIIKEIIRRKKLGIDSTETESAEIKGWLCELNMSAEKLQMIYEVQEYFSIEVGEFIDEQESKIIKP